MDVTHRQQILDAVVDLFVAVDERDWSRARAGFADEVLFDMESMTGEPAAPMSADDIVQGWTDGLAHLDAVHHQVSNFRFERDGGRAIVRCYGIAFHHRADAEGGPTRRFVGTYRLGLVESPEGAWITDQLRYDVKFIDGNLDL